MIQMSQQQRDTHSRQRHLGSKISINQLEPILPPCARGGTDAVTQLITVGIGLDDWEWGVTLWATNPEHLKQIVYDMRFDQASAKYAEFGPFYTSYRCGADHVLEACGVC